MAYTKTNWINDGTPAINAENLNKIEQGIYDNSQSIDNILGSEVYSTDEVKTNKVWIDGKPVYRKVLNIGTPSSQRTYPTHGISNLENVIKLYGFCYTDGSTRQIIPMTYTNWEIFAYDITDTVFTLNFSANQWSANPTNVYVVFEYTKTTD